MTLTSIGRKIGAGAVLGAFALAPMIVAAPAAQAATSPSAVPLDCAVPVFGAKANFEWPATATMTFVGDGTNGTLTAQFSDMPPVSPVPIPGSPMNAKWTVDIDGVATTMTGTKKVTAAASSPVPVPEVTGTFASTATSLADITPTFNQLHFDVSGIDIECYKKGTRPGSTATPTPTPTASATVKPTKKPTAKATTKTTTKAAALAAVPAKGVVKMTCKLSAPLNSPFSFNPTITITGTKATESASKVSLTATMSNIPGLAPVPIENNKMTVTLDAKIGGKVVNFKAISTVNAATKAEVPSPTMRATVTSAEAKMPVVITGYKFDFGEIAGLAVSSICTMSSGTALGSMTVGVGAAAEDEVAEATGTGGGTSTGSGSTLPQTGGGAPLAAIGLWAAALALLGSAVIVLPRKLQR